MTTEEDQSKPCILSTVPLAFQCSHSWKDLRERYNVIQWEDFLQDENRYFVKIDIIFVMSCTAFIKESQLKMMRNVKLFQTWGTGTDGIDLALLRKYKVKLGNSPGATADACADFAMTLLLAAARKLTDSIASVKSDLPDSDQYWDSVIALTGKGVSGSSLGIFGMGEIGYEVAKRARGFRMKIFYHNRNQRSKEDEEEVQAIYCCSLEALLPQVDFLVITAPLTPDTRHSLNRDTLKLMKPDAIVVNIARGGVVNHDDLVDALRNKTIGGAVLDVTEPEPLPHDHALLAMHNVIVTPHISSCTNEALDAMTKRAVDNIDAAMSGKELMYEVS
ncbi:glyoxylate reductase/hydroxypyruvate reductase-like [Lytechinus pictus]|uniref:glyoxylate reductase/hydroxypyruvate reductase-like n=1 Tax=Lytechinus pictus TaxID=7653 RepID=UPI0030BA1D26